MFSLTELIQGILNSELTEEQKNNFIARIFEQKTITDNLFLKKDINTGDYECWFRNGDDVGPTDYSVADIIEAYKKTLGNRL